MSAADDVERVWRRPPTSDLGDPVPDDVLKRIDSRAELLRLRQALDRVGMNLLKSQREIRDVLTGKAETIGLPVPADSRIYLIIRQAIEDALDAAEADGKTTEVEWIGFAAELAEQRLGSPAVVGRAAHEKGAA